MLPQGPAEPYPGASQFGFVPRLLPQRPAEANPGTSQFGFVPRLLPQGPTEAYPGASQFGFVPRLLPQGPAKAYPDARQLALFRVCSRKGRPRLIPSPTNLALFRACRRNIDIMRWLPALLFAAAAWGQSPPFTIEQVLAAAFPTELTAAPAGGKVAWVSNARGVRNIMVAEPPGYAARGVTNYAADDGQEIQDLRWTPGASAILYLRGGSANPGDNPSGVSQDLWIVRPDGSAPRKIGPASSPAVSPRGDQVAFVRSGQIWWQALAGEAPQTSVIRGSCDGPRWSPDGAHIAFTTVRADHSLIGVIDVATRAFRYLDPSTNFDNQPVWAPDSRSIAFIRQPSSGIRPVRAALRSGEPWSIRIATLETGAGRELWRAREGAGSVFREISARNQLIWTDSGRVVFPWEGDAWTHLYSIPAQGGSPLLLTPGAFEVEDAAPASADRIFYSSNENDADRRHIWVVPASGGERQRITPGEGIECSPAPLNDANAAYPSLAFFGSDAQHPLHPVLDLPTGARDLDPRSIPADFPLAHMVTPQPVIFPAADGLQIHGQLFLPPHPLRRALARRGLLSWRTAPPDAARLALHGLLHQRLRAEPVPGERRITWCSRSISAAASATVWISGKRPDTAPSGASEYNDVLGGGRLSRLARRRGPRAHRRLGRLLRRLPHRPGPGSRFGPRIAPEWISTACITGPRSCKFRPPSLITSGLRFLAHGVRERLALTRAFHRG